jgi:DNA repair protein RadC
MTCEIISKRKLRNAKTIGSPEDIYALVKRYAGKRQEHFIVITLNGAHEPVSLSIVFIGLVNQTIVHPREVFFRAVRDMAAAIIVCHNHPSGRLTPSEQDLEVTRNLSEAGEVMGIKLIDHLIFTKKGYFSFRKEGCFPEAEGLENDIFTGIKSAADEKNGENYE